MEIVEAPSQRMDVRLRNKVRIKTTVSKRDVKWVSEYPFEEVE